VARVKGEVCGKVCVEKAGVCVGAAFDWVKVVKDRKVVVVAVRADRSAMRA
jgi:hypothetical protein